MRAPVLASAPVEPPPKRAATHKRTGRMPHVQVPPLAKGHIVRGGLVAPSPLGAAMLAVQARGRVTLSTEDAAEAVFRAVFCRGGTLYAGSEPNDYTPPHPTQNGAHID